jgi:SAM-dependent methyltransferase
MNLFYRLCYCTGITPWERAASHHPAVEQIMALFDREEGERQPPYGKALDLGCGTGHWSVELASRGWQVTGIDIVSATLRKARKRAKNKALEINFIHADATKLNASSLGSDFELVWDFGMVHGFSPMQRETVGREITAISGPSATMLMLAWSPGSRGPLPRGATRGEIEAAFSDWTVISEAAFDATGLPLPLRHVDPRMYRLRRT